MIRRISISSAQAWKVALVAGVVLTGAYFALPSGFVQSAGYNAIGLASVGAVLLGIRLNRPADKLTWWMFGIGSLCSIAADVVTTVYDLLQRELASPSIADALYLIAYPFFFIAVIRLGRRSTRRGLRERQADAAIISLGALALTWQLLMGAYAHDDALGTVAKLTLMAYPIMDIAVLFIVVSALLFGGARDVVDKLIAVAMAMMLLGDFVYDLLTQYSTYQLGNLLDVTWLINYILIGVAALHPSAARTQTSRERTRPSRFTWLPVVAVAAFVSPTMLLVGVRTNVAVLSAVTLVSGVLVAVRMNWMFGRLRDQAEQLRARTESLQEVLLARDNLADDLRHQAFHDSLTGLANRALLQNRIEHALQASVRSRRTVGVIVFDLDGFKTVNDSLGHPAGDAVLVTAAARMESVIRPGDTVARLGGDEFAVLIEDTPDLSTVIDMADRLLDVLREPWLVDGHGVSLSASAGIAFSSEGKPAEKLLREADTAMYAAKSRGKDRHEVFEPSMHSRAMERLQLITAFSGAIERAEFHLDYQPQFALASGRLEGFEALVRWQHPNLGLVAPAHFISLAEETGFIVPLSRWALEAACAAAMTWPATPAGPPTLAVNVSMRHLTDPSLLGDIRTALARSGLPAQRLVLEITESMLVRDPAQILEVLDELKRAGIAIALDDFGTGYSSLERLRRFPIDVVKIDKTFVEQLDGFNGDGRTFVQAILRLARELQLATIAEGIESESQREALQLMGCDSGQGFLLSRPLDVNAVSEFIRHTTANAPVTDQTAAATVRADALEVAANREVRGKQAHRGLVEPGAAWLGRGAPGLPIGS